MKNVPLFAALSIMAVLSFAAAGGLLRAQTQPATPPAPTPPATAPADRWQYGILTLGTGDPVFITAKQEITGRAPRARGTGAYTDRGALPDRANLIQRDVWSNDLLTLDALGAEGWEAVALSQPNLARTHILMRRRY